MCWGSKDMDEMKQILALAFLCCFGSSIYADSSTPRELAEQDIAEQITMCTDDGYEVTQKQNPLILADLDSDGILDALVNNGALVCSDSSWYYYGAAGRHVSLYLSGSDKKEHIMLRWWAISGDENGRVTFNW